MESPYTLAGPCAGWKKITLLGFTRRKWAWRLEIHHHPWDRTVLIDWLIDPQFRHEKNRYSGQSQFIS